MALQARSNSQINRILQPFAPTNGYVDVSSDTTGALFYCYGSVLDSQTSDPTTILPSSDGGDADTGAGGLPPPFFISVSVRDSGTTAVGPERRSQAKASSSAP